jgi:hypothetical protein
MLRAARWPRWAMTGDARSNDLGSMHGRPQSYEMFIFNLHAVCLVLDPAHAQRGQYNRH